MSHNLPWKCVHLESEQKMVTVRTCCTFNYTLVIVTVMQMVPTIGGYTLMRIIIHTQRSLRLICHFFFFIIKQEAKSDGWMHFVLSEWNAGYFLPYFSHRDNKRHTHLDGGETMCPAGEWSVQRSLDNRRRHKKTERDEIAAREGFVYLHQVMAHIIMVELVALVESALYIFFSLRGRPYFNVWIIDSTLLSDLNGTRQAQYRKRKGSPWRARTRRSQCKSEGIILLLANNTPNDTLAHSPLDREMAVIAIAIM